MTKSSKVDFMKSLKDPEARLAAGLAHWCRSGGWKTDNADLLNFEFEWVREVAWDDPDTRRLTLTLAANLRGWDSRELAKVLGVSPVAFHQKLLGRLPLSREELEKIAAAQGMETGKLEAFLLMAHALNRELKTAWERAWEETLAPLSFPERRARIQEDKEFQNWGLGQFLCDKCLEAEDPDEAVALAELALLVGEKMLGAEGFRNRFQAYTWGHIGYALARRGNQVAAEAAFEQSIELWRWDDEEEAAIEDKAHAERLASIVPGFAPSLPRSRKERKTKGKQPFDPL